MGDYEETMEESQSSPSDHGSCNISSSMLPPAYSIPSSCPLYNGGSAFDSSPVSPGSHVPQQLYNIPVSGPVNSGAISTEQQGNNSNNYCNNSDVFLLNASSSSISGSSANCYSVVTGTNSGSINNNQETPISAVQFNMDSHPSATDANVFDVGYCIFCGAEKPNLAHHMLGHSKEEMISALMGKASTAVSAQLPPVPLIKPPTYYISQCGGPNHVSAASYMETKPPQPIMSILPMTAKTPACSTLCSGDIAASHVKQSPSVFNIDASTSHIMPASNSAFILSGGQQHPSQKKFLTDELIVINQPSKPPGYHQHIQSSVAFRAPITNITAQNMPSFSLPAADNSNMITRPTLSHTIGLSQGNLFSYPVQNQMPVFQATSSLHDSRQTANVSVMNQSVEALVRSQFIANQGNVNNSIHDMAVPQSAPVLLVPNCAVQLMQNQQQQLNKLHVKSDGQSTCVVNSQQQFQPQVQQNQLYRQISLSRPQLQMTQTRLQQPFQLSQQGSQQQVLPQLLPGISPQSLTPKLVLLGKKNGSLVLAQLPSDVQASLNSGYVIANNKFPVHSSVQTGLSNNLPSQSVAHFINNNKLSMNIDVSMSVDRQAASSNNPVNSSAISSRPPSYQTAIKNSLFINHYGNNIKAKNDMNTNVNSFIVNKEVSLNNAPGRVNQNNRLETCSSTTANFAKAPASAGPFRVVEEECSLATVQVGNNITISVPRDMADKKDRLQQIINEELVRGILLNDSKDAIVDVTKDQTQVMTNAASNTCTGESSVPALTESCNLSKPNSCYKDLKVELFEDLIEDNANDKYDCDRNKDSFLGKAIRSVDATVHEPHSSIAATKSIQSRIHPAVESMCYSERSQEASEFLRTTLTKDAENHIAGTSSTECGSQSHNTSEKVYVSEGTDAVQLESSRANFHGPLSASHISSNVDPLSLPMLDPDIAEEKFTDQENPSQKQKGMHCDGLQYINGMNKGKTFNITSPIKVNKSIFATTFTDLIKKDCLNDDSSSNNFNKKNCRTADASFASGSSSFKVVGMYEFKQDEPAFLPLDVKVKEDEICIGNETLLFSPSSFVSNSSSDNNSDTVLDLHQHSGSQVTHHSSNDSISGGNVHSRNSSGQPHQHEEDLSLRAAEILADSDSEHGNNSGINCNSMDAPERLAVSEILLANLSDDSIAFHPHGSAQNRLQKTLSSSPWVSPTRQHYSPKQYSRPRPRVSSANQQPETYSCFSSSRNSPIDLSNLPATNHLHQSPKQHSSVPTMTNSMHSRVPSLNFLHPQQQQLHQNLAYQQTTPMDLQTSSHADITPGQNSYGHCSDESFSAGQKQEPAFAELAGCISNRQSDGNNIINSVLPTSSSHSTPVKGNSHEGVVLNLDSCTVMTQGLNFAHLFSAKSSSNYEQQQQQPQASHSSTALLDNKLATSDGIDTASTETIRSISSYISPTPKQTINSIQDNAAVPDNSLNNSILGGFDASIAISNEFNIPYEDPALPSLVFKKSSKHESPKKIVYTSARLLGSPQPSTSGLSHTILSPPSMHEPDYEFDYDSDCYADSDNEGYVHGRSSLPLEQWKCHVCNKMFKSLKEKLLHSGKHSPGGCGVAAAVVQAGELMEDIADQTDDVTVACSDDRRICDTIVTEFSENNDSATCEMEVSKDSGGSEDIKVFLQVKGENLKIDPESAEIISNIDISEDGNLVIMQHEAEETETLQEVKNTEALKTVEACRTSEQQYKCPECSNIFVDPDDLLVHRKKALSCKHICPICHQEFEGRPEKTRHFRSAHTETEYSCPFCYMNYKCLYNWCRHQLHHLGIVTYECSVCGRRFGRKYEYIQHKRVHTGERPFGCPECNKAFANENNLRRHMLVHIDGLEVRCTICKREYKNSRSLIKHKAKVHPVAGKHKLQRDFICSFENCGLVFPSVKKLAWHQENHQRWPKRCEYCNERFVHNSSLIKHVRMKHNAKFLEEKEGNETCLICNKVFVKTSLSQHMRIHSGSKPFKCHICNKRFRVKCNLEAHMYVHSGKRDRPFKCTLCVRSFCRQKDLESHIRSHKNIRPFTCNECGKSFIHKNNLQMHMAQHSGKKEHKCSMCGREFFRKYNLQNHERVHTGSAPFSCPFCYKSFTQKSNYNVHIKLFHVDRHAVHEEL